VIAGVIFDLDGVLLDSEPVWEDVRHGLVTEAGGTWTADAQRRLMGMNTREWAEYLSRELGSGFDPAATAAVVIDRMRERYKASLPLLPGAQDAVRRIGERWPLALASSSPRELIDAVLDFSGLSESFRVVVSSDEVERGKPAPDVYLRACDALGVPAPASVGIEDSTNGIRAALAAGLHVIAIPQPTNPADPDVVARADVVLGGVSELTTDIVERIG
jgi:HAD superfamily hydrolase (TIGR01509 family)